MNSPVRIALWLLVVLPCTTVFADEETAPAQEKSIQKMSRCHSFPGCCRDTGRRQLVAYQNERGETRYKLLGVDVYPVPTAPRPQTEAEYQKEWVFRRALVKSFSPDFRNTWLQRAEVEYWDKVERGERVGRWGAWNDCSWFGTPVTKETQAKQPNLTTVRTGGHK